LKPFLTIFHIPKWKKNIYTQNKLVGEKCINQRIDFEYNEDIIFLKENYRRYKTPSTNRATIPHHPNLIESAPQYLPVNLPILKVSNSSI